MSTIIHDGGMKRIVPDEWAALTVKAMLLGEDSTAAPAHGDEYVSSLTPASNELTNSAYARQTLTGLTATLTAGIWYLDANDVSFGVLTGEAATNKDGIKGWAVYGFVTNDADSFLIASRTFTTVNLNGTEVILPWPSGGLITIGPA